VYFYELQEGDDDVFGDLLLAHDELFEPDEFLEMVQAVRRRVQGGFQHDTLIEAVAEGLELDYGFTALTDDQLTASVHVSAAEAENVLMPTGSRLPEPEWGEDDDGHDRDDDADDDEDDETIELEDLPDYKAILVEIKRDPGSLPH
jgi:hypothetical protein